MYDGGGVLKDVYGNLLEKQVTLLKKRHTMITDIQQLDLSKQYSYADYLTWQFSERVELIKGWVHKMSPALNVKHQRISGILFNQVFNYLNGNTCQVFHAPFDVRLPIAGKNKKTDTVVQPDITVICDINKLDEQGCNGAPDIVMEILSPGNTRREMKEKFSIYQEAKIPEYWLIHPSDETVIIYSLDETDKYIGSKPYLAGDTITSKALNGFTLEVAVLF